jgi:hypothetical protein
MMDRQNTAEEMRWLSTAKSEKAFALFWQEADNVISTPAKPLLCKLTSGGFFFALISP